MSNAPGTQLEHYTILGHPGAGAIGEVWLAKDSSSVWSVMIDDHAQQLAQSSTHRERGSSTMTVSVKVLPLAVVIEI